MYACMHACMYVCISTKIYFRKVSLSPLEKINLFYFSVTNHTAYTGYILGNSGGPAFNDQGECIGVAFQVDFLACYETLCLNINWF